MKKLNKVIALIGLTSTIAATAAFGQGGPLITVDELGNMTLNGAPTSPGVLATDPFSGITTLMYKLPFPGFRGDVRLFEPGANIPSDVLRFDGNFQLFFFSEIEPTDVPPFDPADVAVLPPPHAALPSVSMFETGPEGNTGAFYTPLGNDPGGDFSNPSYHFISDVPEPGSGLLLGLGGGLLWMLKGRRQNKRK